MDIDNAILQDLKKSGEEIFINGYGKVLVFLFKYPEIDITYCRNKHCVYCVSSFCYL